ncbi:hypothetical protein JTB14_024870 [Gonioctena quinquepunctata]|nr:hypothetical protein JTB14_024870 [Gonioctena quinquepunctata]
MRLYLIKQKFLVYMPEYFHHFWNWVIQFWKIESVKLLSTLRDIGLTLAISSSCRLDGAELIQLIAPSPISQSVSRMNPDQAIGNPKFIGSMSQRPRSEVNTKTAIPNVQSTGTVLADGSIPNLSQQEYSVAEIIIPYIHLMNFIGRNQTMYELNLTKALSFQPELQKFELKLSKQVYREKLEKYCTFIIRRLEALCLSGNMTPITADALVDLIFKSVCKKQFYMRIIYLASFYNHVKFLCTQIQLNRRSSGPNTSTSSFCNHQVITPHQMEVLKCQIQQYRRLFHRPEVFVNASHVCAVPDRNQTNSIIFSSSANSSTTLRSPSLMPQGIDPPVHSTFHDQSQSNNPHVSPGINFNFLRSPAHRPEELQTQAHSFFSNPRQINNVPFMSPVHPSTILRAPALRPEGIRLLPYSFSLNQSQPHNMPFMSPAQSLVHRPGGMQIQAYLCNSLQSQITNVLYVYPARPSVYTRPTANNPEGMQPTMANMKE